MDWKMEEGRSLCMLAKVVWKWSVNLLVWIARDVAVSVLAWLWGATSSVHGVAKTLQYCLQRAAAARHIATRCSRLRSLHAFAIFHTLIDLHDPQRHTNGTCDKLYTYCGSILYALYAYRVTDLALSFNCIIRIYGWAW